MSATDETLSPTSPSHAETTGDQRISSPSSGGPTGTPLSGELRTRLRKAAPAVLYITVRILGLLVLAAVSAARGEHFTNQLYSWDAEWYLEIAANGYSGVDPTMVDGNGNRTEETPLAFFPGLPLMIRLLATLPGLGASQAGILVSLVAGIVCAYGLARLGRLIGGSERVGLLLVVLFAAAPMSIVLSMPYTEVLFCAAAAWGLLGVLERRWLLAGLCCLAAGLIRPTGAVLIAVVMLAALVAIARGRDGRRPWAALLLAPAGMLGYLAWVGVRTGEPGGYFEVQQRGWSSSFDGGAATSRFVGETLTENEGAFVTLTALLVVCAVVLLILCLSMRLAWPIVLFAALTLALDLGSDGLMYSKVRLMLPAFPLLLPIAIGLAGRRTSTAVVSLALFLGFGSWFSAYALAVWPYAI
ncbi:MULTISPECIES: hypothetical protein [unclassified Actinopolyspora]|uniref:hypothetical protein n=1 Tax=unclassified Actinopolyspora TaxID=2639451 RepID=UPI001F601CB2|nr:MULTISPECIES: hypothetical protein [unclassified Actinopolyspora]